MTKELRGQVIAGTFFHAPRLGSVEILEDALIAIDQAGSIAAITTRSDPQHGRLRKEAETQGRLERLPRGSYGLPGFVDLHIHAPQYPQLGKALDCSLQEWLQRYTFPLEARFADLAFARAVYSALVSDLAANGTTTAVMYGTIHHDANRLLVDLCREKGLRALIGKVAMDNWDSCPENYRDASPDAALKGTQALVEYIRGGGQNAEALVLPVVTSFQAVRMRHWKSSQPSAAPAVATFRPTVRKATGSTATHSRDTAAPTPRVSTASV